jgi:hypothetical protein
MIIDRPLPPPPGGGGERGPAGADAPGSGGRAIVAVLVAAVLAVALAVMFSPRTGPCTWQLDQGQRPHLVLACPRPGR